MSDDKIVALHPGANRPPQGEINQELLKFAARLLDRVGKGEVVAIAYAAVEANGAISRGWCKVREDCWSLAGAVLVLAHDYPHEHQD
jgi:hypothetical protein